MTSPNSYTNVEIKMANNVLLLYYSNKIKKTGIAVDTQVDRWQDARRTEAGCEKTRSQRRIKTNDVKIIAIKG